MTESDQCIAVEPRDGVLVVRFVQTNLIDQAALNRIKEQLKSLVGGETRPLIVLDMGNIDFLGSSALGMLVAVAKAATAQGGSLGVASLNDRVGDVFDIANLGKCMSRHETVADAVGDLRRA